MSIFLRILAWIAGAAAVGGTIVFGVLNSQMGQDFIANRIQNMLSSPDQQFTFRKISGNLLHEAEIDSLYWVKTDTVLFVPKLRLVYTSSSFLTGEFQIDSAIAFNPTATFHWNSFFGVDSLDKEPLDNFPMRITHVVVKNAAGFVDRVQWFPEGPLTFSDLGILGGFSMAGEAYTLRLDSAAGKIQEPRLSQKIGIRTNGTVTEDSLSLDDVVAQAGTNLIRSVVAMNLPNSSGNMTAKGKKLDPGLWSDLKDNGRVLHADATLSLHFTADSLFMNAGFKTSDTDSILFSSASTLDPSFTFHKMALEIQNLRAGDMLRGTGIRGIRRLNGIFDGNLPIDTLEHVNGNIRFRAQRIAFDDYPVLEQADVNGIISDGFVEITSKAQSGGQRFSANISAGPIFDALPTWKLQAQFSAINPGFWMQDTAMNGTVSGAFSASGSDFTPGKENIKGTLKLQKSHISHVYLNALTAQFASKKGTVKFTGTSSSGTASIDIAGNLDYTGRISGDLNLGLRQLNVAEFLPEYEVETRLNGRISVVGSGEDFSDLAITTSIEMDSSFVAGEPLNRLSAVVLVEDSVAYFHNGVLDAGFADGTWEGRINLVNLLDLENRLQFSVEIQNLVPFRALTEIPDLDASGTITASIKQPKAGELAVSARGHFEDVTAFETTFDRIKLAGTGNYSDSLRMNLTADFEDIATGNYAVKSFSLESFATWNNGPVRGNLMCKLNTIGQATVQTASRFSLTKEAVSLAVNSVSAENGSFKLKNRKPFGVLWSNSVRKIDAFDLTDGKNISISIAAFYGEEGFHAGLKTERLPIEDVLAFAELNQKISGILSADLVITHQKSELDFAGNASITRFHVNTIRVDSLYASASGNSAQIRFSAGASNQQIPLFQADGVLPLPGAPPLTPVKFTFSSMLETFDPLTEMLAVFGIEKVDGKLIARLEGSGTMDNPKFSGRVAWKDARMDKVTLDSLSIALRYQHAEQRLILSGGSWMNRLKIGAVDGFVPFRLNLVEGRLGLPSPVDTVELAIVTDRFDLAAIAPFAVPVGIEQLQGIFSAKTTLRGPVENLELTGKADLTSGGFAVRALGTYYSGITLDASFTPGRFDLKKLHVKSDRGELQASGYARFRALLPDSIEFNVRANQLPLSNRKTMKLFAAADLSISGTALAPVIGGNVTVQDMTYQLSGFGNSTLEDVSIEAEEALPEFDVYKNATVDVQLILPESISKLGQRIIVRNKSNPELEMRLLGEVNILKKKGGDAQLFGSIQTTSGFARQFTKKFDVTRGKFDFSGPIDNPTLDVETLYSLSRENINIYFRLGGTLLEPVFTYESDPVMDTQDIISYTMFGRPFGTLMGWEQSVAGTSTQMATGDVMAENATAFLIEKAGELAGQQLGIDIIEIDNTNRTTGGGTTIKAGKYINDKTVLAVIQQLGGTATTQFTLEYQLKKNLQLILTQSQDSRTGVDILWRHDY